MKVVYNCRIVNVAALLLLQRRCNATATLPPWPSRHHCKLSGQSKHFRRNIV